MDVVLERFAGDLFPGDVIVLNDPYDGGMHLPDIFMFKPIFSGERLLGFSVVIAHHCDVGGRVPGSNASDSTEIFQEGLRIAPMKLYERGAPNRTLLKIIEKNVRLPELVLGDLDAQYATCNIGEREIAAPVRALWRRARGLFRPPDRLRRGADPQGDRRLAGRRLQFHRLYRWRRLLAGANPDRLQDHRQGRSSLGRFRRLIAAGERRHQLDALSFVKSSTYLSVRCALEHDVPNNAGVYRCITVTAPEGSILNPRMPAPVAARALTGYRVVDTVMGALAQIAPKKLMAAGEGGNTVVAIGGYHGDGATSLSSWST